MPTATQNAPHERSSRLLAPIVLTILAVLLVLPLLRFGVSCGHDFDFHLISWLEAAHQIGSGTLHPVWTFTPAYGAGEPRFIFYPPLSWLAGAALTWLLGAEHFAAVPIVFTVLALAANGFTMHRLARRYTGPAASLLISTAYMANPYMLFTAYERTAYAELLAAAWMPLLFAAVMRRRPKAAPVALAIALLWLTNAPAAVAGCYALAFLSLFRLAFHLRAKRLAEAKKLVVQVTSGILLGFALAAFYLTAAIHERPWVQLAMANVPGMRLQDNTLYHRTDDGPHDVVLHTASNIAICLLAVSVVLIVLVWWRYTRGQRAVEPAEQHRHVLLTLTVLTGVIALLLTPPGLPIWKILPQLSFLQFSWRLMTVLTPACGLLLAMAWQSLQHGAPHTRSGRSMLLVLPVAAVVALAASSFAWPTFGQSCDVEDTPNARLAVYRAQNGPEPTDEYTPAGDDNDVLSLAAPAYWLLDPAKDRDALPPAHQTEQTAPMHLDLTLAQPKLLVLHLRNYPLWHATRNGAPVSIVPRQDGLIALQLPVGASHIDLTLTPGRDRRLGEGISAVAFLMLLLLTIRERRSPHAPTHVPLA